MEGCASASADAEECVSVGRRWKDSITGGCVVGNYTVIHISWIRFPSGSDSAYVRFMKNHYRINSLISTALRERRCAFSTVESENAALRRRATEDGGLLRPARGLYIPVEYWNELSPEDRTLHVARGFAAWHPKWVFGGNVAAAIHGFDGSWSMHDGTVTVISPFSEKYHPMSKVKRMCIPSEVVSTQQIDGVTVLDKLLTVLTCAIRYDFPIALAVVDAALRQGMSREELLEACSRWNGIFWHAANVIRYGDARSENGGESYCRAVMIENGFAQPQLQTEIIDSVTGNKYRADYLWRLHNGRTVIGEFDGTEKYVNPSMNDRQDIREVVRKEREREDALRRSGITDIVRFNYQEVVERDPFIHKLADAGVPRYGERFS